MFKTLDGKHFLAEDELDLVSKLHQASYSPSPSDAKFMFDAAERAQFQVGRFVRSDTPENFISDLIAVGLITEVTAH